RLHDCRERPAVYSGHRPHSRRQSDRVQPESVRTNRRPVWLGRLPRRELMEQGGLAGVPVSDGRIPHDHSAEGLARRRLRPARRGTILQDWELLSLRLPPPRSVKPLARFREIKIHWHEKVDSIATSFEIQGI